MTNPISHFINENRYCLTLNATPILTAAGGIGVLALGIIQSNEAYIILGSITLGVSAAGCPLMTWLSFRMKRIENVAFLSENQLRDLSYRVNRLMQDDKVQNENSDDVTLNSMSGYTIDEGGAA